MAMGTQAVPFISLPEGTLGRVCCVQGFGPRGRGGLRVEKEGTGVGIARVTPAELESGRTNACPVTWSRAEAEGEQLPSTIPRKPIGGR